MYVDLTTIVTSDAILGFALHSKSFTRRTYNTTNLLGFQYNLPKNDSSFQTLPFFGLI